MRCRSISKIYINGFSPDSSRGILRGIDGIPELHFLTGQQVDLLQRHCRGELTAGKDFEEHIQQKLYSCLKIK